MGIGKKKIPFNVSKFAVLLKLGALEFDLFGPNTADTGAG